MSRGDVKNISFINKLFILILTQCLHSHFWHHLMPTCDDNSQESQTTLKFIKQPVNYGPHLLTTWLRRSSTVCMYYLCCGISVMGWDHCAVRHVGKAEVSARLLERILLK